MTRFRTLTLMVVLAPLVLLGQEGVKPRLLVVTADRSRPYTVRAWEPGATPGGATKVWEARPRTLPQSLYDQWSPEVPILPFPDFPAIADYDHDGVNELLMIDALGLTVYGRSPAYYAFPVAGRLSSNTQVVVADVDADGLGEILVGRGMGERTDKHES